MEAVQKTDGFAFEGDVTCDEPLVELFSSSQNLIRMAIGALYNGGVNPSIKRLMDIDGHSRGGWAPSFYRDV